MTEKNNIQIGTKFQEILKRIDRKHPFMLAVIGLDSKEALEGALKAAESDIATPVLFGEKKNMEKIAKELNRDIANYQIVDANEDEAMRLAIQMTHKGEIHALMKGSIHSDKFMHNIVRLESGLRTGKRMTHCMVVDVPAYHKLITITDCALNIAPTFIEKQAIVQNAIDLMHSLGVAVPKVALLSAIETINEKMPTTFEYAALCKMADRGQISGGLVDGPLSFDLAISQEAVACKKLESKVAGDADILLVPEMQAGNIVFKALEYFADSVSAGIVLGAKVPVILTSRAAGVEERVTSALLGRFYHGFLNN